MCLAFGKGQKRARQGFSLVPSEFFPRLPRLSTSIIFRWCMRLRPYLCFIVFGAFLSLSFGCGGDDAGTGATASLSWDPGPDEPQVTYTVHYGKTPTGEEGSCNYESSVDVTQPFAMITGLEYSTRYYFAVSAYNGERSLCSNEVTKQTPERQLEIGDPPVNPIVASASHE